jgi:hypothetical protein
MRPNFAILRANFSPAPSVLRATLFKEIGWDDLVDNKTIWDTCAAGRYWAYGCSLCISADVGRHLLVIKRSPF